MKINEAGLSLLKGFESCSLESYPDPGTGDEPWTIGYGHTGNDIHPGMSITQEQADDYLQQDISRFERGVSQLVSSSLNDNQFSALVCFTYNVGLHNFSTSTMLKKINERAFEDASKEFLRWNRSGGEVLEGLTRRREAERQLFLS